MPAGRADRKAEVGRGAGRRPRSVSEAVCLPPAVCHKQKKVNLKVLAMARRGEGAQRPRQMAAVGG